MWGNVARLILRNRAAFLIAVGLLTVFMAYQASFVKMSYEYASMLPESDIAYQDYQSFKNTFGEEANIFVIGVQDSTFFTEVKFNDWKQLTKKIESFDGVANVLSVSNVVNLTKNKEEKRFETHPIFDYDHYYTQNELDSLKGIFESLSFYKNKIYNDSSKVYLSAVRITKEVLDDEKRVALVDNIKFEYDKFSAKHKIKIHYSGLPYIRTAVSVKIKEELNMFIFLALFVCIVILYIFFRSFKAVFFSILVVAIGVIWSLGTISLFDYRITILTGMIPPLLIVIGIPNSIFLLNKYHAEYKSHGNKIKALQRVISKIGNAIFLTNLTTASGFATFIFTNSDILKEFGIIASINIIGVFILAILLIPIFFSFLPPPRTKHTKHLENKIIYNIVEWFIDIVIQHRKVFYIFTAVILALGIYGVSIMKSTGYIVDDLPKNDPILLDLKFFENNFKGVMPLEIVIDTRKKGKVIKLSNLKKIEKLSNKLFEYEEIAQPLSLTEVVKFSKQAYYNGNPKYYKLPSNNEKNFILSYAAKNKGNGNLIKAFVDSTKQKARISVPVADIGTVKMEALYHEIKELSEEFFPKDKYDVVLTGMSVVFFKGTKYLINNLYLSLSIAVFIIALFMSVLFRSFRMVIVSLIPNFFPLIITAGLMGYFGIPIKPSTILVFSIAFGISVDDTIHFLAKYRQELKIYNWNIKKSVVAALRETGVSMIYTSIVLFFGFGIFTASSFGGTVSLGLLVAITLFVAMFANLILLPALLLTLERRITTKAFKEPLIAIFEEEEDIELDDLRIEKKEK